MRWLFLISLLLTGVAVSAQDLGSSNKLFGGKATAAKKSPPKGTAAPTKTSANKTPKATRSTSAKKTASRKPDTDGKKTTAASRKPPTTARNAPTAVKTTPSGKPSIKPAQQTTSKQISKPATEATRRFENFGAKPTTTGRSSSTVAPVMSEADAQFERFIDAGNAARDDRDYPAAESAYTSARSLKPKDARAIYGLGNLYSDQQRWDEAENAYRTALQLDPASPVAHIALSYVLIQPIAVDDLADRYQEAESLARKALELDRHDPLAFDQLGVSLEMRGLLDAETENAYKRAIQLDPTFAPAYAHLGRLLRKKGRQTESRDTYSQALKYATDVPTKILVAEVMQSEQRFADSETLLRDALAGDPKNPAALLDLGRALLASNKLEDAEKILLRALDLAPNSFPANSLLADLYIRRGTIEKAENSLLRTVVSVPNYEKRRLSQQFEAVGDAYMKSGNRRNAERAYQHATALDPDRDVLNAKLARVKQG